MRMPRWMQVEIRRQTRCSRNLRLFLLPNTNFVSEINSTGSQLDTASLASWRVFESLLILYSLFPRSSLVHDFWLLPSPTVSISITNYLLREGCPPVTSTGPDRKFPPFATSKFKGLSIRSDLGDYISVGTLTFRRAFAMKAIQIHYSEFFRCEHADG